tara:strand:+ start:3989 stop:4882 length:894 start_codon:yes stop_codon:yes gene_type:complete
MKNIIIIIFINLLFTNNLTFNGDSAFEYLKKQCDIGPRYPGSDEHKELVTYLKNHFTLYADTVEIYKDSISHPVSNQRIEITNLLIRHNTKATERYLFMAHFDTRDRADKDKDINNINKPIIGANDGASGVALLMELSYYMHSHPLKNIGVDILLVDAEDMGNSGHADQWGLGTQSFVKNYKGLLPKYAICVDMIADKNPIYKIEGFSYKYGKDIVYEIWNLAQELGYKEFVWQLSPPIYDDHYYFYQGTKVPSIDIIDFDYPHWHTIDDTVDNCSSKGLFIVGNVLLEFIYRKDQK